MIYQTQVVQHLNLLLLSDELLYVLVVLVQGDNHRKQFHLQLDLDTIPLPFPFFLRKMCEQPYLNLPERLMVHHLYPGYYLCTSLVDHIEGYSSLLPIDHSYPMEQ